MNTKLAVTLMLSGAFGLFTLTASARPDMIINSDGVAGRRPGNTFAGTYSALDESMRAGSVTSINEENVVRYGQPRLVMYEGEAYWQVPVTYRERTYGNGVIISEARALVRNGRVEHWLFRKSAIRVP